MRRPSFGIALIGYRATGKSTVGRRLAEELGLPFVDADVALEQRAGRSISEIFASDGESKFRDAEEATLADLVTRGPAVIATGGGVILRPSNRDALRRFGRVIWLTARPEVLAERLARAPSQVASRPALTASGTLGEIHEVLQARIPLYEATSDVAIETEGRTAAQVAIAARDWLLTHEPELRAGRHQDASTSD